MKLQIVSDIHLEFDKDLPRKDWYLPKTGDSIALLGDIGHPKKTAYQTLIEKLSDDYQHVFLITGNHEYYGKSYSAINQFLTEFCSRFDNVHFLHNNHYIMDNIRIIGSTLWSYIPQCYGFSLMDKMNDYRYIYKDMYRGRISFHDTNRWYGESVDYIKKQIDQGQQLHQQVVVLTHHSPLLDPSGDEVRYAFGSNLTHLLKSPVKLWAHGHTHQSRDQMIDQVRIVSNQRGYPKETTNFNPEFVIDI